MFLFPTGGAELMFWTPWTQAAEDADAVLLRSVDAEFVS